MIIFSKASVTLPIDYVTRSININLIHMVESMTVMEIENTLERLEVISATRLIVNVDSKDTRYGRPFKFKVKYRSSASATDDAANKTTLTMSMYLPVLTVSDVFLTYMCFRTFWQG